MIYAPKFPLKFKQKRFFENVSDAKELVRFHLTNLLLTAPGEKISDPNYGVGLRLMLFENITPETLNNWQDKIIDAVETYLTYINLGQVLIEPFFDLGRVNIKISYRLLQDTEQQILELSLAAGETQPTSATY